MKPIFVKLFLQLFLPGNWCILFAKQNVYVRTRNRTWSFCKNNNWVICVCKAVIVLIGERFDCVWCKDLRHCLGLDIIKNSFVIFAFFGIIIIIKRRYSWYICTYIWDFSSIFDRGYPTQQESVLVFSTILQINGPFIWTIWRVL